MAVVTLSDLQRTFPRVPWTPALIRATLREVRSIQAQRAIEDLRLVLGRPPAHELAASVRISDPERLDRALAEGKGALLVFPHAGNALLSAASLGTRGIEVIQIAARGSPPPPLPQPGLISRQIRAIREAAEDRLPMTFHPIQGPPRALFRALDRGAVVAVAFDGRGGAKFRKVRWLGRESWIASGPWTLAARRGVPIVPAVTLRDPDRRWRLHLGPAIPGAAEGACEAALAWMGLRLSSSPAHYVPWMAHCARRAGWDDRPLFAD